MDILEKIPRVVRFKYKNEDNECIGNIVEELGVPELVVVDKDGVPSGIRYELYGPILVGAVKSLSKRLRELEEEFREFKRVRR